MTSSVGLFDSALQRAFDADKGPARLVDRAEIAHADYVLKLDVRTFEARYDQGQAATPTIVVEVHAALDRTHDRIVVGDRSFKAAVTASDNRVGAIAEAFDQAVAGVWASWWRGSTRGGKAESSGAGATNPGAGSP